MAFFDFIFKKNESQLVQLPYNTDIHSHIIPGVDDGSKDVETSLFLISKLKEWGVYNIVATPHRTDISFENSVETISPKFELLKNEILSNNIDINLSHSFEYRLDEGFIKLMNENKLIPLKNSYILIENSFIQPLWNLKQIIYELILKGFTPILAHPERYSYYFDNKNEYLDLHQKGCLFQINILSLTDVYGKEVRKTALWLIEKGLMDFISTDLHNKKQAELIELYLRSSAYKKILPHLTSKVKNDFI